MIPKGHTLHGHLLGGRRGVEVEVFQREGGGDELAAGGWSSAEGGEAGI